MERQLCSGTASWGARKKACGEDKGEQTKSGVTSKKALAMILTKKNFFKLKPGCTGCMYASDGCQ